MSWTLHGHTENKEVISNLKTVIQHNESQMQAVLGSDASMRMGSRALLRDEAKQKVFDAFIAADYSAGLPTASRSQQVEHSNSTKTEGRRDLHGIRLMQGHRAQKQHEQNVRNKLLQTAKINDAQKEDRCCWNRKEQTCDDDTDCDNGGEGCIRSYTYTSLYGKFCCTQNGQDRVYNEKAKQCQLSAAIAANLIEKEPNYAAYIVIGIVAILIIAGGIIAFVCSETAMCDETRTAAQQDSDRRSNRM